MHSMLKTNLPDCGNPQPHSTAIAQNPFVTCSIILVYSTKIIAIFKKCSIQPTDFL